MLMTTAPNLFKFKYIFCNANLIREEGLRAKISRNFLVGIIRALNIKLIQKAIEDLLKLNLSYSYAIQTKMSSFL